MYMPLCRECFQYKSNKQARKYDEPASADEKALLSSTSTAFNDSGSDKNNSFDANKPTTDRLIDMD